jgi:hypothetical protein
MRISLKKPRQICVEHIEILGSSSIEMKPVAEALDNPKSLTNHS